MNDYKEEEDQSKDLIELSARIEKIPDVEFSLPNLFTKFETLIEALQEPLEDGLLLLHLKDILAVIISISRNVKSYSIPLTYIDCLMDIFDSSANILIINQICGIFSYIITRDSCLSFGFYDPSFFVIFIEKLFTTDIVCDADYVFAFIKILLTHEEEEIRLNSREAFGLDFLLQLKEDELFVPPGTYFNCISALISDIDNPDVTHHILAALIDLYPRSHKNFKVIHPLLEFIKTDKLYDDDFSEELNSFSDIIREQFENGNSIQAIDIATVAIGRLTTLPYFVHFNFDKLVEYLRKFKDFDIMENLLWLIDMLSENFEFLQVFFAGDVLNLISNICCELEFKKRRQLAYAFSSIIRISTPQYFQQILEYKLVDELFAVALESDDDIAETAICDIMKYVPKLSPEEKKSLFSSISTIVTLDILDDLTDRHYSEEYDQAITLFAELIRG